MMGVEWQVSSLTLTKMCEKSEPTAPQVAVLQA